MISRQREILANEKGFVLVASLLILLILVIIGIAATNTTLFELQIAGNERAHKKTFYAAEGGAELGAEIIEQNIYCPTGFTSTSTVSGVNVADLEGTIRVFERNANTLALYQNVIPNSSNVGNTSQADAAYPLANIASGKDVTYLYLGGETKMAPGGSLQMAAGYEGKGKSAAGGGVTKIYDINSQHLGQGNSETIVTLGWRFPVDWTGDCNY